MLVRNSKSYILIIFLATMFLACSESDSGAEGMSKTTSPAPAPKQDKTSGDTMGKSKSGMDNGVIYQDEIYKNWPYQ